MSKMNNQFKQQNQKGGLRFNDKFRYSMDMQPLVSIITVVLNSEKYIDKTIDSVLKQTYNNCEYIIIDGGSSDKTIEIIKKYEDKIDYWISEVDNGIYEAMNKGICLARGHIIGILNSGDFYVNDALEKIVNIYNLNKRQNNSNIVIIGAIYRFSENEEVAFKQIVDKFDSCGPIIINHPATFATRSVYDNIGYFNLKYKISADYDLILRGYNDGKTHFIFIDDTLTHMMMGGVSEKFSTIVTRLRERFYIRSKYINLIGNIHDSCCWIFKKIVYYLALAVIGYKIFEIKFCLTIYVSHAMRKIRSIKSKINFK